MKKIFTLFFITVLLVFVGCDTNTVSGVDDSVFSLESSDSGATDYMASSMRAIAAPGGLKVSFRSSDIEFWATGGDFTDLRSKKYEDWYGVVEGANVSTEIGLSDSEDNVVFMPNKVKLSEYDMPDFDRSLVYDVARMDIGSGNINFTMNGSVMDVTSPTLGNGSLNANSIVFIDRDVLQNVVYISRDDANTILSDYQGDSTFDNTYDYGADTQFILNFIVNNTGMGMIDDTYMDVDGALFVPFDPVDFTGNSQADKVKIKLEWDLDTVFTAESGGTYTLSDVAGGTPFNFNVSIEIK